MSNFTGTIDSDHDLVAIVDDDDAARDALEFLLNVLGRKSRAFASPAAFLAVVTDAYRCLLLDQHMPEMTGTELAFRLRSDNNRIPIMLLSGNITPEVRARAQEVGIDMICDKPPESGLVADFVARALESEFHA